MSDAVPVVLFVDDEAALLQEFPQLLQYEREVQVLTAGSVDEAFAHIEAAPQIDLAILDFQLPMAGSERLPPMLRRDGGALGLLIADKLRRRFPATPVLFWSGSADQSLRGKALRLANSYSFPKHVGPRFVQNIVYEMLDDPQRRPRRRAFIVHGHDHAALQELRQWIIDELGIDDPMVLRDLRTGGKTLIDKLESYGLAAEIVFVLLTPDDAVLDKGQVTRRRARQNVIFELGYFFGRLGRKTGNIVLLHKGDVELPSDLHGMVTIDITGGIAAAGAAIRREIDRPDRAGQSSLT